MCTSLSFGKQATAGGQIIVARNEDLNRDNWNKYMVWRDTPEYASERAVEDGIWTLGNGLQVQIPASRLAYSAMPDAAAYEEARLAMPHRFFFEERGINENNVAVTVTCPLIINERAAAADPLLITGGIARSVIPTLLLPQAHSARQGIELLGHYIEQYGASEVNGVIVADTSEAWYLENGSAHHWIAVRIPDDSYLVVASGMRIHGVDLDAPGVLHSHGLYEFALEHQLLGKPQRHDFNFARAFGLSGAPGNTDRLWLAQRLLTPSRQQPSGEAQYPLFLQPDSRIDATDVMAVLRATYQGTALGGSTTRPIGCDRIAESHIICLDGEMPKELQGLVWQAISTPLRAPYIPIYNALQTIPHQQASGTNDYSGNAAYWALRSLFSLVNSPEFQLLPRRQEMWQEQEAQLMFQQPYLQAMLAAMYQQSPAQALECARNFSAGIAMQMVEKARIERNRLMNRLTEEPLHA